MSRACVVMGIYQILLLTSCQIKRSGDDNIVIPLDITTNRPIVELTMGGKGPYRFIFDTGSSANVMDETLYQEFGFRVVGEDPLRTPGSENKLMSRRVAVPKVGFFGTSISEDVEMNVMVLKGMLPVDGILSSIFFSEYLVTLDYAGSRLILASGQFE